MFGWLQPALAQYNCKVSLLAGNVKSYEDANVIVATVSKVSVGFDEKESCSNWGGKRINMLILPNSILNNEQVYGRAGRAPLSVIVEFSDKNRNIKNHLNKKRKWSESRGGIILELKENEVFCWEAMKNQMIETHISNKPIEVSEVNDNEEEERMASVNEESEISISCSSQDYLSNLASKFAK